MTDLLDKVLEAHGGLERWRSFEVIEATLQNTGLMWKNKGWGHILEDENLKIAHFTAHTKEQRISLTPFNAVGVQATYRPDVSTIETLDGKLLAERAHPRSAFADISFEAKWDELQLAYFRSYAMWNYLTTPFAWVMPGIVVEEIEPWNDRGVERRRLRIAFPKSFQTHCPVQEFHIDDNGLLARLDYQAEVVGAQRPTAHYTYDYKNFQGIMVPTTRKAYRQDENGDPIPDPVVVAIDIIDVKLR